MLFVNSRKKDDDKKVKKKKKSYLPNYPIFWTIYPPRVFHSGGAWGWSPPSSNCFRKTPLPSKPMLPHGAPSNLKMKTPHLKNNPFPPLRHAAPFHKMVSRKSTINNNLKSSYNELLHKYFSTAF